MFGSRRLAKRSIIGTRICAPWQDGRFYPGVVQAMKEMASGHHWYSVQFDDGYTGEFTETDIVGPGFQGIQSKCLKHGQKIFLTQNGREVTGVVVHHDIASGDVTVDAKVSDHDHQEMVRKVDELRLVESRKSARLQDTDTDYSKLADVQIQTEASKKRTVSHVIDVPSKTSYARRSQTEESEDIEMMDENMAAMVLTSLSCSPQSPKFPVTSVEKREGVQMSPKSEVGSFPSSGYHSGTPSPPQYLSTSAPVQTGCGRFTQDEGIDVDIDEKPEMSTRTVFKCSWPGCLQICSDCGDIERHIRVEHLKKMQNDSGLADHEEEFYYSEVEVAMDTMMDQFADMACTSPTALFPSKTQPIGVPVPDHDYQRKEPKIHIPHAHGMSSSVPINIPHSQRPWQLPQRSSVSPPSRVVRHSSQDRIHHYQGQSPKTYMFTSPKSPTHKKSRSEVKKCRKVYGMENREMWCTQCKWKKACTRFME